MKQRNVRQEEIVIEEMGNQKLQPEELREFKAREINITAQQMTVNISGRKEPIIGYELHSKNDKNHNPLEIKVIEGEVFRKTGAPNILIIPKGMIEISGKKEFGDLKRFRQNKGELPQLPIRDPDLTTIDGSKTFKQTGTLIVKVDNAEIIFK